MQADGVGNQPVVRRVGRIDRPVQTMRIPEPVGPDFLSCTRRRNERIVVRNAITAILAHRARRDVVVQIGNDPKDLPHEIVETLRIGSDRDDLRLP